MARYFFDWRDDHSVDTDEEGFELPDLAAVEREATRSLIERAHDILPDRGHPSMSISVRDAANNPVLSVSLRLDVEFTPGRET